MNQKKMFPWLMWFGWSGLSGCLKNQGDGGSGCGQNGRARLGWVLGGWGWGRLADLPEFRFLLLRKEGIKVLACNYSQSLLCICNRFSFSIFNLLGSKMFYICMYGFDTRWTNYFCVSCI